MAEHFKILKCNVSNRQDYERRVDDITVAIKIQIGNELPKMFSAESTGELSAFEKALNRALFESYPREIAKIKVVSFVPMFVNVESAGTGAEVKVCIGMKYNGDELQFWGKPDQSFFRAGRSATEKGYNECLTRMLTKEEGDAR